MPAKPDLAANLLAHAEALAAYPIDDVCTGAFWEERFGERGRHYIKQDAMHHVTSLACALQFGVPSVMEQHARWLQSVLTVRGMCTRHIEEHFESLARATRNEIPDSRTAVDYLDAARAALIYEAVVPRTVQARFGEVVAQAADIVVEHNGPWFRPSSQLDRPRLARDISYLLSYLIDALALSSADTFVSHARWMTGYYFRRGLPDQYLPAILDALAQVASIFPEGVREEIEAIIVAV